MAAASKAPPSGETQHYSWWWYSFCSVKLNKCKYTRLSSWPNCQSPHYRIPRDPESNFERLHIGVCVLLKLSLTWPNKDLAQNLAQKSPHYRIPRDSEPNFERLQIGVCVLLQMSLNICPMKPIRNLIGFILYGTLYSLYCIAAAAAAVSVQGAACSLI